RRLPINRPWGAPPAASGRAAGGSLAGPHRALRPPKSRPGGARPPLPPRTSAPLPRDRGW
ncbi:hypothetical protein P7K49_026267, partial [Saguinus oedipus]